MSCKSISEFLVAESGRFMVGQIFRDIIPTSPWFGLTSQNRGVFPEGMSEVMTNWTFGRNAPDLAEPEWHALTSSDGDEGGACLPPVATITFGSKPRSFRLFRQAIEGPDFCAENFRSKFEMSHQLNQLTAAMKERVRLEWEIHDRAEYGRMVDTKVVVNSCDSPTMLTDASGTAGYPNVEATQVPGIGFFENFMTGLLRDGSAESALLTTDGTAVLTIMGGLEFINNLKRQNFARREDIRWAESGRGPGSMLMARYGVRYTYEQFMFLTDLFARRFNFVGGQHVQVAPWIKYNDTNGTNYRVNPLYNSASEEELVIYDPMVYQQLVPSPSIVNPAPEFRFDPVSYTGDIAVKNIIDRKCNPDGTILFHRMIMAASSMPMFPRRGIGFLIKRCGNACENVSSCNT